MMHRPFACLFLSLTLLAQQPDPHLQPANHATTQAGTAIQPDGSILLNRTAGLHLLDGELWGGADGYKVRFDAGGFEFTPALGRVAPRNYPMTFQLDAIGRGSECAPVAATAPRHEALRVEYDHGTVIERYDLGNEGMEQSFVFASRPLGSGDLVVRARLQTDLLVKEENGGLCLEQPGIGGCRFGSVTGIDANGLRVHGAVRYQHGIVELSLPAEFVDRAALPFVLDPFISVAFGLNLLTQPNDRDPLAAFDATNDCYLVIWSNLFSATDTDVNGQRISRAGSVLGTRIFIETSTAQEIEPSVANVNGRNAFVVVYNRNGGILGRTVSAGSGAVSALTAIAVGFPNQHSPSVGGNPVVPPIITHATNFNAVCVWEGDPQQAVLSTQLSISSSLLITVSSTVHTLGTGVVGHHSRPRISKNCGGAGRYIVAFERLFADKDPWVVVVGTNGAPLTNEFQLDARVGNDEKLEVDGDGVNWVVAWQHEVGTNSHDVYARSFSVGGSPLAILATPVQLVVATPGSPPIFDEILPSVIWTGEAALIGLDYRLLPLVSDTGVVISLDPFHCVPCEGVFSPHLSGAVAEGPPFGCAALSGGGPRDDALLVWMFLTASSPTNADIAARLWRSADGTATSLGGGCGSGGTARATCARVPNPNFVHRLLGATPSTPAFLCQSLGQGQSSCGPCNLFPDLNSAVVQGSATDLLGNAASSAPIPNIASLIGLVLFEQWVTLRAGGACSVFSIDLSNALRVVIE